MIEEAIIFAADSKTSSVETTAIYILMFKIYADAKMYEKAVKPVY
jgi:hypothetical protein